MNDLINKIHCEPFDWLTNRCLNESIDLILMDPPFGVGYSNNFTRTPQAVLAGDERGATFDCRELAAECFRVLKPDSALFCFTGWSTYPDHYKHFEAAGFSMREPVIGQKRPSGKTDLYGTFQSNSDWVIFAHKGRFRFRSTHLLPNLRAGTIPNKGRKPVADFKTRFPSCWFGTEYPWSSENPATLTSTGVRHPTVKGRVFCEWLIRVATDPGAIVLDPFVGSGTTALAALRSDRRFICGDISQIFCDDACRQLSEKP